MKDPSTFEGRRYQVERCRVQEKTEGREVEEEGEKEKEGDIQKSEIHESVIDGTEERLK